MEHTRSVGASTFRERSCPAQLSAHAGPREEIDIDKLILNLDLDGEKLRSCYVSEKAFERANEQYRAAVRGGIRFVPGHKVDGKRIEGEALQKLLD